MTKEEREVMRMALERLKEWVDHSDCLEDKQAITAIEKCLANDALEKKAENARELGLDYEPEKTVCPFCSSEWVTAEQHDRKMDRLEQKPVAWSYWQSCLNDDGTQTTPWVHRLSEFKPSESVINKDIVPLYTKEQL